MNKIVVIILGINFLVSCSMGGFKPPKAYYVWYPGKQFYSATREKKFDFFEQRELDMRSCGMDPVRGESSYLEVNLCLEKRGWYLKQGPVCEEKHVWDEPLCIKWRAKYSKPDAKPWGR